MRVAIIGAGPAGAMAAVRLARAGASVTLFDPSHPREKPCGGGLTGRALALVSDVIDMGSLPAVVVKSATVEGPGPHCACCAHRSRRHGRQFPPRHQPRRVRSRARWMRHVAAGARLVPEKAVDVAASAAPHDRHAPIAVSMKWTRCSAPTAPTASCARSSLGRSHAPNSRWPRATSSPMPNREATSSSRRRANSRDICGRFRDPITSP